MKLELHILQNFAPSNLNRDDTGAPKDCEFGGHRRARISSQCLKRAIRDAFTTTGLFTTEQLAVRTKRLVDQIAEPLVAAGRAPEIAAAVVTTLLKGGGLGVKDDGKTEYLLFLPRRQIGALTALAQEHWDALVAAGTAPTEAAPAETDQAKGRKSSGKDKKKAGKQALPKAISDAVVKLLKDGTQAPDLALFGRMIADASDWNVDAACQVAHALSTNRVAMEFDFYTAVDDFRPEETSASDMMGTIQFNSACFYRYAVVDVAQLADNLGSGADDALVQKTLEAFVRASVRAIPTGKQNSMAAQNPPSYVLAIVRENGQPVSLANAFVQPVRPRADTDLVTGSVQALEAYFAQMNKLYGDTGVIAATIADRVLAPTEGVRREESLEALVATTTAACGRPVAAAARPALVTAGRSA
jgi:CRISPR system Cascade subunit CasC